MDNALLLVQVLERSGDSHDDMARKLLAEVGQSYDLVEQLATGSQLQNDVVVLLGLGEFDELDDVGMIELAHDLDLFENIGALDGPVSISVIAAIVSLHRTPRLLASMYTNAYPQDEGLKA